MSMAAVARRLRAWPRHGLRLSGRFVLVAAVLLLLQAAGFLIVHERIDQAAPGRPDLRLALSLAVIAALGMGLVVAGSVWTARRVTQPLRRLVHASERLGSGNHAASTPDTDRDDEIGELARAFDRLRTDLAAQQQQIRDLAFHDRLTGLPNRLQFREEVQMAIALADPAHDRLAVLMLDLDRFKHVNDVLGQASGDRLLVAVAARLRQLVREGDVLGRLGGDGFALLMHDTDLARAMQVARRIGAAFKAPLALDDHRVDLSAGLGIAAWPDHADEADALLGRAEVAMLAAKRHTGGVQVYDPALDSASGVNLALLGELQRALAQGEMRLFLQPKITLQTGEVCGAEALVRWQHPERGLVPPTQFIPCAEQTGFIRRLTLWMFEQAAAVQVELALLGVRRVSVNLSGRDLLDGELPDKLDAILRRHRALADGFCLEITERVIMDDPQRAEAALQRLAERGFRLSIDDFGTGYSSLAGLKRLPLHELKIDRSFVMAMAGDPGDTRIVRAAIELAHILGLSVVAEGVEDGAVLRLLQQLHCDEGQGYHMSKPLAVAAFCDWVAQWQASPPPTAATPAALRGGATLLH